MIANYLTIALGLGLFGFFLSAVHLNVGMLLEPADILFVAGGTILVATLTFTLRAVSVFGRVFFGRFMGRKSANYEATIIEIVSVVRLKKEMPQKLSSYKDDISNPFLRDAIVLLDRSGEGGTEAAVATLRNQADTFSHRYAEDVEMLKTIAKFPPVLGAIATMVHLMAAVSAAALVPLVWGLFISSIVLIPLCEKMIRLNHEDTTIRKMIIEGMRMMKANQHPVIVEEHLKSFLLPSELAKFRELKFPRA